MSSQTLAAIQAKRLALLKASGPVTIPAKEGRIIVETTEDGNTVKASLPPPASEEDVVHVTGLWKDNQSYLAPARQKLANGQDFAAQPDWGVILHQLFAAWIVNFGHDPSIEEAQQAAKAGDDKGASVLLEQSQELIYKVAQNIGLEWIPFIDLALTAFDPEKDEEKQESGPFGGVFISRGESPFMILAFKGTTYQKEVNTDKAFFTVQPREGVLYGESVHRGMYQGLFERFPGYENIGDAFDITFENLELVAKDIQGSEKNPVPLYVAGHSLGAGYADLAYIELMNRLENETTSYKLLDNFVYGAPRVGLNSLAQKVKAILSDTNRNLWRITRKNDIVPTIPSLVPIGDKWGIYKHFDVGYRLTPADEAPYFNVRISEIDSDIHNDPFPSWKWHWPIEYFDSIKKVIESS